MNRLSRGLVRRAVRRGDEHPPGPTDGASASSTSSPAAPLGRILGLIDLANPRARSQKEFSGARHRSGRAGTSRSRDRVHRGPRTRGRKERGQSFEPPADRGGYRARVSSPTRRCAGDRRTRITSAPTRPSGSRVLVGRLGCRESARSDARARVPSETRALEARRQNAAGRGIATRRSDYVDAPRRDEESASACLLRVSCVCAR